MRAYLMHLIDAVWHLRLTIPNGTRLLDNAGPTKRITCSHDQWVAPAISFSIAAHHLPQSAVSIMEEARDNARDILAWSICRWADYQSGV